MLMFPGAAMAIHRPVVSEHYDELVFASVREQFWRQLMVGAHVRQRETGSDAAEAERIAEMHKKVQDEVDRTKASLHELETESNALRTQIDRIARQLGPAGA